MSEGIDPRLKVLVIDDDELIRGFIVTFLRNRGYLPLEARDGRRGLELFRIEKPALLLVDLRLPEMNGLGVLAGIGREIEDIPVIVISGTGDLEDAIEALRLGAWDFVTKPIDLAILEYSIRRSLERAGLLEEHRRHREFLEEEVRRRTADLNRELVARQAAQEALRQSLDKLQSTLASFIRAMTRVVETRDPYTAGHQQRVSQVATAIALEIGCSEEQVHAVQWAAIIHDIGKIYIPAEILNKPGKLTEIEFEMIKVHARVGFDILAPIEFPWAVAEIVHQHHERLDGSGYPQGLTGESISPGARILQVADVVEAMAAHRPYRPSLGIEQALEEIKSGRDRVFDPAVADACLKLFREGRLRFE